MKKWVILLLFFNVSFLYGFSKEVSGDVIPPVLTYSPPVSYPSAATCTCTAKLSILIDEKGFPKEVTVISSVPTAIKKSAISWARRLIFKPAMENGSPIKVRVVIPLAFKFEKKIPSGEIEGYVFEKGTGKALQGIEVFDSVSGKKVYSGKGGFFSFGSVTEGTHRLFFIGTGYYKSTITIKILPGKKKIIKVFLIPRFFSPYAIDVVAIKPKKEISEIDLPVQLVKKIAGTGDDVIRVVQRLPGVTMVNELSGFLLARGSGPFDNRILIDGIDIPYVFHFGDISSVINGNFLNSVSFFAGGFSVKYGNAMGGIVDAKSKNKFRDGVHGVLGIGSVYSEGSISYGGKVSLFGGGRRSYFDLVFTPLARKVAGETNTKFTLFPYFYDYQIKSVYSHKDSLYSLMVIGSKDAMGLNTSQEVCDDPYLTGKFFSDAGFNYLVGTFQKKLERIKLKNLLGLGNYFRDWEVGAKDFIYSSLKPVFYRGDFTFKLSKGLSLLSGGEISHYWIHVDSFFPHPPRGGERTYTFTDAIPIREKRSYTGWRGGVYLENDLRWGKTEFFPGIRMDYMNQGSSRIFTYDPRIRVVYNFEDNLKIKGAAGVFHQLPSYRLLDPEYGNPNLDSGVAYHYIGGVEYEPYRLLYLEIQCYYKWMKNLIYSDITFPDVYENSGVGYSYGVDIFLRKHFSASSPWWGWIAYSYSRSKRKIRPGVPWSDFGYDRPHTVNIALNYVFNEKWEINIAWRYSSGDPYKVVEGAIQVADLGMYVPITGNETKRNIPYHRLDLRIEKKFLFNTWKMDIFADLMNLYVRKNPVAYLYDYDYSHRYPVVLIPFAVNLGLKGEF